jgi:DNA-binding MarR family transcriptional regulator
MVYDQPMADEDPVLSPGQLDIVVLAQVAGQALALETERRAGGDAEPLPARYGFVFQHLVDGPRSISELAQRLGVTQQAASKTVGEMEAAGLLARGTDPEDARVRRVALSAEGRRAIDAARGARAALAAELEDRLGTRRLVALRRALLEALEVAGGAEAVARRRVFPLA